MKKTLSIIMVLVMVLGLLAGCGGAKEEPKAPESQAPASTAPEKQPEVAADPIVLSIGHVNAGTETDQLHWAILQAKAKLEELSGGTMSMDIFADGSLGSEREHFEMCSYGTLDMAATSTSTCNGGVDELAILEMPYLFPGGDPQARAFLADDGGTLDFFRERWENEWKVKNLALYAAGFRNLMGNGEAITDPSIAAGKKIRTSDNVIIAGIIEKLKGIPTNVAWSEIYTAYQQGVIDAGEWPIFSAYNVGFQEVTDYCVRTEFYPLVTAFNINMDKWNSLTVEQQGWLVDAIDFGLQEGYKLIDNLGGEYFKEIEEKNGCVVYEIDKTPFVETLEPMWTEFRDYFGGDLIDAVRARVAEIG